MDTRKKIILVADDDRDIRLLVTAVLYHPEAVILQASDGREALEILQTCSVDLAILDITMPEINGIEVCYKMKEDPYLMLTPALILTARDTLPEKIEALERGADDFMSKPFHARELRARVQALLRIRDLLLLVNEKTKALEQANEELLRYREKRS